MLLMLFNVTYLVDVTFVELKLPTFWMTSL